MCFLLTPVHNPSQVYYRVTGNVAPYQDLSLASACVQVCDVICLLMHSCSVGFHNA